MKALETPNPPPAAAALRRERPLTITWGQQLDDAAQVRPLDWLWDGYLAAGQVTLLTGRWKTGKSTLTAALLAKLWAGGPLGGRAVTAGRALVLTEESAAIWKQRREALALDCQVGFLFDVFRGKPSQRQWLRLIQRLVNLHATEPFHLLVLDPLASFLPGVDENLAGHMLRCLLPLRRLTQRGVALLLLHHPAKTARLDGTLARGSGALPAFADIVLEMTPVEPRDRKDRRRLLIGLSRHSATPHDWVIKLNEAGTDYEGLGTLADAEFARHWPMLAELFSRAEKKLTRRQVSDRWEEENEPVSPLLLWRWLDHAEARGLLCRDGANNPASPFRYWHAEHGPDWQPPTDLDEDTPEAFLRRMERDRQLSNEHLRRLGVNL